MSRPRPERRETSRPPGAGFDEIRNRAQHQDCQSTRLGSTDECGCPCRQGDRDLKSVVEVKDIDQGGGRVLRWLESRRDGHGSVRSHNFRRFVTEGGLICFGIDQAALYRLAASYVATAS